MPYGVAWGIADEGEVFENAKSLVGSGELLATMVQANWRPTAQIHLATREARVECRFLRAAWALYGWLSQARANAVLLRQCRTCGEPTGNFCDVCNAMLCTHCEEEMFVDNINFCAGCR